jgi:hypothetical protein
LGPDYWWAMLENSNRRLQQIDRVLGESYLIHL